MRLQNPPRVDGSYFHWRSRAPNVASLRSGNTFRGSLGMQRTEMKPQTQRERASEPVAGHLGASCEDLARNPA